MIDYKFNEGALIEEFKTYVDKTYDQHYAGEHKIQTTEIVMDRGRGEGFCLGNVDKYSNRYGKKGGPEEWRKDLMKIMHYALLALYNHDQQYAYRNLNIDISDGDTITLTDVDETLIDTLIDYDNMNMSGVYQ